MADHDILHGDQFLEGARANPGRVAVPRADNEEALEAVAMAVADGVLRGGTLLGRREAVEAVAHHVGLDLSRFDLVPIEDDAAAAAAAVRLVVDGQADFLLKGQSLVGRAECQTGPGANRCMTRRGKRHGIGSGHKESSNGSGRISRGGL